MLIRSRLLQAGMCMVLVAAATLAYAKDSLPPRYHEWLTRDAVYIITREEREAFLKLGSDAERDKFIERFWEVRNPSPGAPGNEFREEHYRRLAYANQYFGHDSGTVGWRTDMGRVYIELGKPEQKAVYLGYQELRPMEIWFYQSSNPALPPYFYVVFYKPDISSDFRLYSPYIDGPEKLVTTNADTVAAALKTIERQAGREVARTSLSLLPDEPVDLDTGRTSLQSDVLLSKIKSLADQPLSKELLNRRREILESVTHRVLLGSEFLDVLAVPLRDSHGNVNLHYVLRLRKPEDFTIAQGHDGRYYYGLEVTARVFTTDRKPIFTQTDSLSHYLSQADFEHTKNQALAYEGVLPLAPGRYKLQFVLSNKVNQTAYQAERDVEVPAPPAQGLLMTPPVAFSEVEQNRSVQDSLPFSIGSYRFEPQAEATAELVVGQDLQVFYQLWQPSADPASNANRKLLVEYGYGRPGVSHDSKVLREDISRDQFDAVGSLLTGKRLPLATAPPGNYRLMITVTDPESSQKTYGTLAFRISREPAVHNWYVYDDHLAEAVTSGVADYHRALCYLAFQNTTDAERWLKSAAAKNLRNPDITAKLVDIYSARHAYAAIVDLYRRGNIDESMDEATLLRTAESLDRTNDTPRAIALLESALRSNQKSGPLHLALAAYYKRAGDLRKAEEMERQGKLLMASSPGL